MTKKSNISLNLLKIISIWFVVGMHFLSHSGYLLNALNSFRMEANLVWLVRSFIMVAVNCFVLITGYYQSDKESIKLRKCSALMGAMLFYSIAISIIMVVLLHKKLTMVQAIYTLFPFSTKSYWYMTCYLVLYLMSPYINRAFDNLDKKTLGKVLLVAVVLFSIIPTVFNSICSTLDDTNGFGIIWFVVLYLTGYWLRKSGFHFCHSITAPGLYVVSCILTFTISVSMNWIGMHVYSGFQGYPISNLGYNYVTVYVASVALFLTFLQISVPTGFGRMINTVAGCTGGVYLIHEHPVLREALFTQLLRCDRYINEWKWIVIFVPITGTIVAICIVIEIIRQKFIAGKLHIVENLAFSALSGCNRKCK